MYIYIFIGTYHISQIYTYIDITLSHKNDINSHHTWMGHARQKVNSKFHKIRCKFRFEKEFKFRKEKPNFNIQKIYNFINTKIWNFAILLTEIYTTPHVEIKSLPPPRPQISRFPVLRVLDAGGYCLHVCVCVYARIVCIYAYVCMCIYMYMHMYVCVYICICTYTYSIDTWIFTYASVHMIKALYANKFHRCVCVGVYACIVCIYVYVCIYICIHIHTHTYKYIYIHMYIFI